jgi:dihydrofolate synthase/folylpolyglutamate synthase
VSALLRHFTGLAREVIAVPVEGEHKSWPPEEVVAAARAQGVPARAAENVEQALELIRATSFPRPPRILIAGSLYLAASVLALNGSKIE